MLFEGRQMDEQKRSRLQAAGWTETTVEEFLELDSADMAYIQLKLALSKAVKARRLASNLTQAQFAKAFKSSQSRVAKMENGDPSVSVDLLVRALFTLKTTPEEMASYIRDFDWDDDKQDMVSATRKTPEKEKEPA